MELIVISLTNHILKFKKDLLDNFLTIQLLQSQKERICMGVIQVKYVEYFCKLSCQLVQMTQFPLPPCMIWDLLVELRMYSISIRTNLGHFHKITSEGTVELIRMTAVGVCEQSSREFEMTLTKTACSCKFPAGTKGKKNMYFHLHNTQRNWSIYRNIFYRGYSVRVFVHFTVFRYESDTSGKIPLQCIRVDIL